MTVSGSNSMYRARLVDVLWRLKRAIEKDSKGQYLVHFNLLQNDQAYLDEVIEYGQQVMSEETDSVLNELSDILNKPNVPVSTTKKAKPKQAEKDDGHSEKGGGHRERVVPATTDDTDKTAKKDVLQPLLTILKSKILLGTVTLALVAFTAYHFLSSVAITVDGDINGDTRWHSGQTVYLEGLVYVNEGVLTIEPGVTVKGNPGSALVVTKSARIHAVGTPEQPIVFTSAAPVGERASGDWGGVVLLGDALVNKNNARIEGVPESDVRGEFGGDNAEGSCGVLSYARIEFAGFEAYANNELNGLTLGGCGSSTVIDHLQVHMSLDDGIEFFGGSANMNHIVITGAGDDSLDWDLGWTGQVQFLFIQMFAERGDNGFEGDNNGKDFNAEPRSEPTFYNVTMVSSAYGKGDHRGMVIREGSGLHLHNFVIEGFGKDAIDFRDVPTQLVNVGKIDVSHGVFSANRDGIVQFAAESGEGNDDRGFIEAQYFESNASIRMYKNRILNGSAVSEQLPDPSPNAGYGSKLRKAKEPPQSELFNEQALYMGALEPSNMESWFYQWASFPKD